ncbi:MAG: membrane protein insertase YidC [Deltaproteobacteria bacterium]|nr:membrane protein insertase YidC [Deltaproteobacteria bacterium]MBW1928792.1 membrane protein insertase YidC [Deltaproteobacteria bacterium]MBW2024670.1 membrane protein insertase YidC [Deltaproteobacteria bacterium]MBW2124681.1 membrane protein insertase YidC [Deltaproteobacteria bacterium]RLB24794.1 MAG: membrane protein insertase YidC [Deltaproteobacteria bacterium]
MDKRMLLAFVLSFLVLFLWSIFFSPSQQQAPKPEKSATNPPTKAITESQERARPAPLAETPPGPVTLAQDIKEKEIVVETPLYRAVLSNLGPTIKSFKLKGYRETIDPSSPLVDLVDPGIRNEFIQIHFSLASSPQNPPLVFQSNGTDLTLEPRSGPAEILFYAKTQSGLEVQKRFRFYPDQYRIDVDIEVLNRTMQPLKGRFIAQVTGMPPKKKGGYYAPFTGLIALRNGKVTQMKFKKKTPKKELTGNLQWVAYQKNYFICAIVPQAATNAVFQGQEDPNSGKQIGTLLEPPLTAAPGAELKKSYTFFLGPRQLTVLKQFGRGLDKAVDFGWTNIIAKPLLYALRFFNKYIHNYGVSIILLTILIKILFWPLTHKSYKSMKEMQKLQPIMAKIREKYKDNREQMNKEMMALYRTYKVNPMSGCLPMIIQIPVFFALYRILGKAIELRHAPFMLWINDLSAPDRLFHFSFKVPFMAPPYGIPVLTLLMGASMYIQQKMTPTPGDPTQAKFMMFLPIIFTFMFINFPSGLVLYWLVNNILSIGQQYRIQKRMA